MAMSRWRKALLIDPKPDPEIKAALDKARHDEREKIMEMDAGLRRRDPNELLDAWINDSITGEEYRLYEMTWETPARE